MFHWGLSARIVDNETYVVALSIKIYIGPVFGGAQRIHVHVFIVAVRARV